jgi:hypothetical protein
LDGPVRGDRRLYRDGVRRLVRALSRHVGWPLARTAAGGIACFTVAGLMTAGIGLRSTPVLIAYGIVVGLVGLDLIVTGIRAWPSDQTFDIDDQVDITYMRPLPRWLRMLVFVAAAAALVIAYVGPAAVGVRHAGNGPFITVGLAGFAAMFAFHGFGKGLAARELLREKAGRFLSRQRLAEVAEVHAMRAARHRPSDPDAATRRRIAEREGFRLPPSRNSPAGPGHAGSGADGAG